jgi:hypothetical protein
MCRLSRLARHPYEKSTFVLYIRHRDIRSVEIVLLQILPGLNVAQWYASALQACAYHPYPPFPPFTHVYMNTTPHSPSLTRAAPTEYAAPSEKTNVSYLGLLGNSCACARGRHSEREVNPTPSVRLPTPGLGLGFWYPGPGKCDSE